MKIEDCRLHLKIQYYCIVHIYLIMDVVIVVEMIPPYPLWVNADLDLMYRRQAWMQRKVHKRLIMLHRVAKVKLECNMSN